MLAAGLQDGKSQPSLAHLVLQMAYRIGLVRTQSQTESLSRVVELCNWQRGIWQKFWVKSFASVFCCRLADRHTIKTEGDEELESEFKMLHTQMWNSSRLKKRSSNQCPYPPPAPLSSPPLPISHPMSPPSFTDLPKSPSRPLDYKPLSPQNIPHRKESNH